MKKHVLMLTTSAFILACSAMAATAQQSPGMMGHGGMMGSMPMRIIFALMDGDGDGTVSLQEFQAAHEKIFKAMDTDKDGTLTLEEMQTFMRGTGKSDSQHEH